MYIYIYLEPVNVLYFGGWTLPNKVFSNQEKGHLGSRERERERKKKKRPIGSM